MAEFYKKAVVILLALVIVTGVWGGVCFKKYHLKRELLPLASSYYPWQFHGLTDSSKGGRSSISINENNQFIDYSYVLTKQVEYPYVTGVIAFDQLDKATTYVDLGVYSMLEFRAKCSPENILSFHLHTFDPGITNRRHFSSYRIAEALITCTSEWSDINIDLRHLDVPEWWLSRFNLKTFDKHYDLNKVIAFSLSASSQGPVDSFARVSLSHISLQGVDSRYIWFFVIPVVCLWGAAAAWLIRSYTRALVQQVERKSIQDRPIQSYKKLAIDSASENTQLDKILRFMATEYSKPDMSLAVATSRLGINRTKLNKILKDELGLTFNAYLNKLRLVEAARILEEKEGAVISEIAYRLGYSNAAYFIRLFKVEYGCTPKTFREQCMDKREDHS